MKRNFSQISNLNNSIQQPQSKFRRLQPLPINKNDNDINIIKNEINNIKHDLHNISQEFRKDIIEIRDLIKEIRLFIGLDYKSFGGPTPSYFC